MLGFMFLNVALRGSLPQRQLPSFSAHGSLRALEAILPGSDVYCF